MEGREGGSSTPSFRETMVNKGKTPLEPGRGNKLEGEKNREEEIESNKKKESDGKRDKDENDKK